MIIHYHRLDPFWLTGENVLASLFNMVNIIYKYIWIQIASITFDNFYIIFLISNAIKMLRTKANFVEILLIFKNSEIVWLILTNLIR